MVVPCRQSSTSTVCAAGTGFTSTWSNAGAVSITDAAAATIIDGDNSNLTSLTATIVGSHTGDVLTATPAGAIAVSYDAPNHVLYLTGVDSVANYQSVLRSIKYDNTSGGPGVDVTVNFVGTDAQGSSESAAATIVGPVDIHITNAFLFDGIDNNPNHSIAAPVVGETVQAEVNWSTSGAPRAFPTLFVSRWTVSSFILEP